MRGIASPLPPRRIHPRHKWRGMLRGSHKALKTRIEPNLTRKLNHLSVDADVRIAELVTEAVQDTFKKYEKKSRK